MDQAAASVPSQRFLLAGEPLALLMAQEEGPLGSVSAWSQGLAGAELNVAVGLTRLGHEAEYLTRLGTDPFGDAVLTAMGEKGVSTARVARDSTRPTGSMLKGLAKHGDPDIYYYRAGSAASALSPMDVNALDLGDYHTIHLTGILPALSASCREAAYELAIRGRAAGARVTFDPNVRPSLWNSSSLMQDTLQTLGGLADVVLPGIGECEALLGTADPEEAGRRWLGLGASLAIIKLGPAGAYWVSRDGSEGYVPGYEVPRVVDTVGAGDGFAAGAVSALAEGLGPADAAARGCAIGALQVTRRGDNDGLPTREELAAFMGAAPRASLDAGAHEETAA